MIRTTAYLVIFALLIISCQNTSEKTGPTTIEAEVTLPENNTGLVTKGTTLFGSKDDTKVYLEANLIGEEAETVNRKADSLRQAYQANADNIDVNFELGTHFAALGGFTEEDDNNQRDSALIMLSQVIETNPTYKDGAAYFNRAQTFVTNQKWDEAIEDINTYLEIDPEPSAYTQLLLAQAQFAKGDSTKACEHINTMQEAMEGSYSSATSYWIELCK